MMTINQFVHTLRSMLNTANINFGDDADSVLGLLYGAYYDQNCMEDSDEIKQAFEELYKAMNGKTIREMDEIIYPVCSLCCAHQQLGFIDGLKLGLLLAQELNNV